MVRGGQSDAAKGPVVVQPGAPGTPSKVLPPSTRGTLPPQSQADVAFMQGMIMHHAQAVEMTALIASHTENKDLRLLGARIQSSQSGEIKFMKRWLAARNEPIAMAGKSRMDTAGPKKWIWKWLGRMKNRKRLVKRRLARRVELSRARLGATRRAGDSDYAMGDAGGDAGDVDGGADGRAAPGEGRGV